jgi:hypothetical protein
VGDGPSEPQYLDFGINLLERLMSIETWKKEFYPISADSTQIKTDLQAINHSIKKWEGLRSENLERHGLKTSYESIMDSSSSEASDFRIDGNSCALCTKHYRKCRECPLHISRDSNDCDTGAEDEDMSPYLDFTDNKDPEPMIFWLIKAKVDLTTKE